MRHILVLSFCLVAVTAAAEQKPVRVYLAPTAQAQFIDADSKRLADTRSDVLSALGKKKQMTVVADQAQADVILEVTSAKMEPTGSSTSALTVLGTSSKTTYDATVRIKLTAGSYEHEFAGRTPAMIRIWQEAAKTAVDFIEKWVKDNRAQLDAAK